MQLHAVFVLTTVTKAVDSFVGRTQVQHRSKLCWPIYKKKKKKVLVVNVVRVRATCNIARSPFVRLKEERFTQTVPLFKATLVALFARAIITNQ